MAMGGVARARPLSRGVRRREVEALMRQSVLLILALVIFTLGAAPPGSQTPTFSEAAAQAEGVVRVRVTGGGDTAATFTVVEVVRGKDVPKSILVSSELWNVHRPKPIPEGDITYLVLLRTGEELLCGHMNGLIILSHTCIGIVPVVDDNIPAEYASSYDRDATQAVGMEQVRKQLRQRKRDVGVV